jgi:dihydroxy-acid dehydratase
LGDVCDGDELSDPGLSLISPEPRPPPTPTARLLDLKNAEAALERHQAGRGAVLGAIVLRLHRVYSPTAAQLPAGVPALLARLTPLLDTNCLTVTGRTLGENIAGAEVIDERVILPIERPLSQAGGTFVLRGNLAPNGCVIKPTAAESRLLKHTGRAIVFDSYADLKARIDDPSLGCTADDVLVLRNAGPLGAPGMPEWGMLPIPKPLLEQGVRDMVRISDARMSGTSYGTCVLHVAPEAAVGGPLALVKTGDRIALDVEARTLELLVDDAELDRRRAAWQPPAPKFTRGYGQLFLEESTQADHGCDFRFLERGDPPSEPDIF